MPAAGPTATSGLPPSSPHPCWPSAGVPQAAAAVFSDYSGQWKGFQCVALCKGSFHQPPPSAGSRQPFLLVSTSGNYLPHYGDSACLGSEPRASSISASWHPLAPPQSGSTCTHPLASGSWPWQPPGHPTLQGSWRPDSGPHGKDGGQGAGWGRAEGDCQAPSSPEQRWDPGCLP